MHRRFRRAFRRLIRDGSPRRQACMLALRCGAVQLQVHRRAINDRPYDASPSDYRSIGVPIARRSAATASMYACPAVHRRQPCIESQHINCNPIYYNRFKGKLQSFLLILPHRAEKINHELHLHLCNLTKTGNTFISAAETRRGNGRERSPALSEKRPAQCEKKLQNRLTRRGKYGRL